MVPEHTVQVISVRYRFVSVCFRAGRLRRPGSPLGVYRRDHRANECLLLSAVVPLFNQATYT